MGAGCWNRNACGLTESGAAGVDGLGGKMFERMGCECDVAVVADVVDQLGAVRRRHAAAAGRCEGMPARPRRPRRDEQRRA